MHKRPWQVEWQTQARPDGFDRLGQMVKLVIDHAVVPATQPRTPVSPPRSESLDGERSLEERNQ